MNRREFITIAGASLATGIASSSARAAPHPTRLVFVHGRSQQGLDPAQLQATWLETLRRGAAKLNRAVPAALDVAFPYYGDKLDEFARQLDIPLTTEIQARGSANDEFLRFQAELAEAMRQRAGITNAEIDYEYGSNPKPKGPQNWEWVQAMIRTIDRYGGGASQWSIEMLMRDVFLYTTRAGVRDQIDRIVKATLNETPCVVVGHSLGSVVAYNVLRSDPRRLKVSKFVTVGSPLAIRAIRDQLRPINFPTPATAWYNAFDTRDVVALYPLDAVHFPVNPAISNYNAVQNSTPNRHGIIGYLDDADVAKHILDALI